MRKNQKILAAIFVAVLMLGTTSCGSTEEPAATPAPAAPTAAVPTTAPTAAPAATTAPTATTAASTVPTATAAAPVAAKYPDYLNLDGFRPIVKEGTDVTLKMMVRRESIAKSDINDQWLARFTEDVLNIDLELEEVFGNAAAERKNLALASNDLPDMMLNMGVTSSDLVRYGMIEKMFMPVSDYVDAELTPNLWELLPSNADGLAYNTTPDGKMYTTGNYADATRYPTGTTRVFINTNWMEKIGLSEAPKTLDGWLEMLRAFKNLAPEDVGAAGELIPMISSNGHDRDMILNTLGFIGGGGYGAAYGIDVKTRELVVPAAQPEYAEYLRVYNTMYSEGLLHPDYITMDRATARANITEGTVGAMADSAPYLSCPDTFDEWISASPMTSTLCSTAQVPKNADVSMGNYVISANTQYPEVAVRYIDYLYSPEQGYMSMFGPAANSPDTLGIVSGFKLNDAGDYMVMDDVISAKYESDYDYRVNAINLAQNIPANRSGAYVNIMKALGVANPTLREHNMQDGDDHYYVICNQAQNGYFYTTLPPAFLNEEDGRRAADLSSTLTNHITAEAAKFIVGQRPLSEVEAFQNELKTMGVEEYLAIYQAALQEYMDSRTDWTTFRMDVK